MLQPLGRDPAVCAEAMLHPVFCTDEELGVEFGGGGDGGGVLLMTQDAKPAAKTDMHTPEAAAHVWATTLAVLGRVAATEGEGGDGTPAK